jgi:hypothetical protein
VLFIPAPLECGGSIPSAGWRDPPSALRTSAYHCAYVYVRAGAMEPSHPPVSTAGDPSNSTVGAEAAGNQCTPTPLSLLRRRSASTGSGPEAGLGLDTIAAPWIDQGEFRTACGSKRCPGVPVVGLPVAWGALQTGGRPPSPPTVTPPSAGSALSSASVASRAFTSAVQDRLRTLYVAWVSEAHARAIRRCGVTVMVGGSCETQNTRGHQQAPSPGSCHSRISQAVMHSRFMA